MKYVKLLNCFTGGVKTCNIEGLACLTDHSGTNIYDTYAK